MPLTKAKAPETTLQNKKETTPPADVVETRESKPTMSKEDYWRRREERDIATQNSIRRSGLWQAAIQSTGLLQYNVNGGAEEYLKLVEAAALKGLAFVENK